MREKCYLDNDWYFSEKWETAQSNAEYDEAAMQSVRIPHTVKELPFHYFDEHAYQMVSGYRRHLLAKKEWEGKVVRLTFEGVAHDSEVYVVSMEKRHVKEIRIHLSKPLSSENQAEA